MSTHKKLLLFVLVGIIIGLGLVGCARHSDSEHPSNEQPQSEHPE